jgi:hypothetical protein
MAVAAGVFTRMMLQSTFLVGSLELGVRRRRVDLAEFVGMVQPCERRNFLLTPKMS